MQTYFEDVDRTRADPHIVTHAPFDVDHGRLETRFHGITADVSWLVERHPAGERIKSIGMIDAKRESGDKVSLERRLYISRLPPDPQLFALTGRAHGGRENALYYVRDVAYREDVARIKTVEEGDDGGESEQGLEGQGEEPGETDGMV